MRKSCTIASEAAAWLSLAVILAIGLPLFVCMPLWVDTTYHDMSARNILWGGVHYRDIFETNLPGMVWIHAAIRPVIGWTSEAMRIADFAVVGLCVLLIMIWMKKLGVPRQGRVWFAAAAALFYLYETEFIHCQRDSWMLLPTVIAMHLRGRQVAGMTADASGPTIFRRGLLEGIVWGCAVWIKPHCVVPAIVVWLVSLRSMPRDSGRQAKVDFFGLVTGGLLTGAAGSAWLIRTGAWSPMWDVLLNWNGEYYSWSFQEMDQRMSMVIMYFAPWSLIHYLSIPLAVAAVFRLVRRRFAPDDAQFMIFRALLAALYLGWLAQATLLQKSFHYAHAPVLLLALAVAAAWRWPLMPILIAWTLVGGWVHSVQDEDPPASAWLARFQSERPNTYQAMVPRHKLFHRPWRDAWRRCFREGASPELKDYLSFYSYSHCTPGWHDLDRMRGHLETMHLRDGDLICWDDSTHPLYLDLKIRPAIRYMHVNTALDFRSKRGLIRDEIVRSGARYVVSDLAVAWCFYGYCPITEIADDTPKLPADFPCWCEDVFPWNQPIIFRAGRYALHRIENPITAVRIPYPIRLGKP